MAITEDLEAQFAAIRSALADVDEPALERFLGRIERSRRVFVTGAGRSLRVMEAFATRLLHLGFDVHVAGAPTTPPIAKGDALVVGSRSGRTSGPLSAARTARDTGAQILAITSDARSPLWRLAEERLRIGAPKDAAAGLPLGQPAGILFEQSLFLLTDLMVARLMKRRRLSAADLLTRHANLE